MRVDGITLYPWVFVRSSEPSMKLLNHEWIHYAQVKRVGLPKFYYLYLKEYIQNRLKGMKHYKAYLEISFEKEAREYESCPELYVD